MAMPARSWACGLLVVGMLVVVGCGGATGRPVGKVTWKGSPVAQAELRVVPASDPDRAVFGVSGPDGAYHLDFGRLGGVPAGACKVTITRYTLPNGKALPEGEQGAALRGDADKVVRHFYEFDRDVPAGGTTINFELSEGRPIGKEGPPVRSP